MTTDPPLSSPGVVVHGRHDLRVENVELTPPQPAEAVVSISYGGICGSDLHYWRDGAVGDSIVRAPLLLGHEIVGTVLRAAADGSSPEVGTAVAVHPATPAPGDGARFPIDRPNLSPGCTYLGSAARFPHTAGGFVAARSLPSRLLRPLPDGLSLRTAVLIEPASVAWRAVGQAGAVAGKRVLVIGVGPIGALAVAVLRRAGAADIIVVDRHRLPLDIATRLGATSALLAGQEQIAGVDADLVIEASGSSAGLASAVRGCTRGGRIVLVGMHPSGEQPALLSLVITRELQLVGSFRFNDEIDQVIAAMADGSLVVDAAITHEFEVADALEAFSVAQDPSRSGKVLLRF